MPRGADPSTKRAARRLVILVGAVYLVAQLLLFPRSRGPSWDEAVYLSQVTKGVPAVGFAPSRARGITLLVAPVTASGGSLATVRLFLILVSAAALVASFVLWVPALGLGAPLAAFLFASSWPALLYASEVMPNLWAALLGVAATGALVRRVEGGERWGAPVAATLLGVTALFRPADALVLFAGLVLYIVIFRRSSLAVLIPLGVGLDLLKGLVGVFDKNSVELFPDAQDLPRLNVNIRGLPLETSHGLVDQDSRMGKRVPSPLLARPQKESGNTGTLSQADRGNLWPDVLHGVIDGQTGRHNPSG